MERREILKRLTVLPLAGSLLPLESLLGSPTGPLEAGPNIYQSIGVEPVINCRGTFTIIGGSIERPRVRAAMEAASGFFVQYDELAFGVGRRLAELTGAEYGMVSAGCAAGMKHVTAACVAGGNPEKLIRIPDLSGFEKNEVVIPARSRTVYDHAIRNIGVKIITVNSTEELIKSLSPRTAMIYMMAGNVDLPKIAEAAKPLNIPILVDAAAEDLTVKPNVHLQQGATVVAYSGGKALCGPQCAGLLLGPKNLLMSAWQASSPHHGPGRDNKVGKEEMLGMLAAVEDWVTRDHVEKMKTWNLWLDNISKRVSSLGGITCSVRQPVGIDNASPRLTITWDVATFNIDGQDLAEELAIKPPRIALSGSAVDATGKTTLSINAGQMQLGNDKIVGNRIVEVLSQKRPPKSTEMAPASFNLTGRWDVDIEFYSSKSQHTFYIESQDGNWIQGAHKGEYSTRELVGVLEGDQVKLSSAYRAAGDNVPFLFYGTATADKMSGEIYLGEYIRAKFTATKNVRKADHRTLRVPKGQPLSS
jgi:seryl-tRNA(Sec) selenium transferase